jgi:sugar O-acyltransferase (sialic acid O-acetyltransferase NeuD family)
MTKKLFIFPSSGNGLEALDCLSDEYQFMGFIDDDLQKQKTTVVGHTVFPREILLQHPDSYLLAVVGGPLNYLKRAEIINSFQLPVTRFAQLIHPKAIISKYATIGYNTLIMAGVVVNIDATLNNHVIIMPNTVIHHEVLIEDYTIIGSGVIIAGNTHIGNNCYVASGSNLTNSISVGEKTMIGLGSNVLNDVESHQKIAGNPARKI